MGELYNSSLDFLGDSKVNRSAVKNLDFCGVLVGGLIREVTFLGVIDGFVAERKVGVRILEKISLFRSISPKFLKPPTLSTF